MTTSEIISSSSSVVQACATFVLVGVTIYYAYQTKKTVNIMDRNSKESFLPIIMIGINRSDSNEHTLNVTLENVGKGLAKRPVKLIFPGVAPIFINSIPVGGEGKASIAYNIGYILNLPENERKFNVEYQDIFGRNIKTEAFLKETHILGPESNQRGLLWDAWYPVIP